MSSTVRTQKVGVIGATGAVGAEMIKVGPEAILTCTSRHVTSACVWVLCLCPMNA